MIQKMMNMLIVLLVLFLQVRERLVAIDVNKESLASIESSIGLFSIEEESPKVVY
jgi:hypothetical protein